MQFIDLAAQQKRIRSKIEANIHAVLDHGQYVMGPEISKLEERLAAYCETGHAISCSSGTDALLMALMAHEIGPGDAVFTTPFTFIATAEVIGILGATPVFVDIDQRTFNIDPAKLKNTIIEMKDGSSGSYLDPKGIIAVDLFGLPADYDKIGEIAEKYGLFVIQDAAQSFGAEYKGKKACGRSLADIACTSFFPAKPLGCYGDGGAVFTDNGELAEKMTSIRIHGMGQNKYENVRLGSNCRMDTIQAAVLLAKLDIFSEEIELRQQVAKRYTEGLARNVAIKAPVIPSDLKSAWAQYSVLLKDGKKRKEAIEKLNADGIPTAIYYPIPLHLQTAFSHLGHEPGDFPVSEDCADRILSVPMHPYLEKDDQDRIVGILVNIGY